jgi:hypothetical protein
MPRDVAILDFWTAHDAVSVGDDDVHDVQLAIAAFFNVGITPQTHPVCYYLSNYIARANCRIVSSLLIDALVPGTPHFVDRPVETPFTLGTASAVGDLPLEVASCLSFTGGALAPGRTTAPAKAASRRGRVYVGPLNEAAVIGTLGEHPHPRDTFMQDCTVAGSRLITDVGALGAVPGDVAWVVYSRTTREVTAITGGYMDDEWDTQRRRGGTATSRVVF